MSSSFRISSIDAPFHTYTAIDGMNLHFSGAAALKECGASMKGNDVVDRAGDPKDIQIQILFSHLGPLSVNAVSCFRFLSLAFQFVFGSLETYYSI